jgi:hypothetical protein
MDGAPGEIRTPDRSVRSLNCELVILYKSTTCDLDQSRYVVMKRVNESYLVMCWYIIATHEYCEWRYLLNSWLQADIV